MSYANCKELKDAIASWVDRTDLAASIPLFVANAEAMFNRTLRLQRMIERVVAQTDQQFVELPTDCAEVERVNVDNVDLTYTPPFQVDDLRSAVQWQVGRAPAFYSVSGTAVELMPPPSSGTLVSVGLYYYQKITPLVNDADVNWLLLAHPDLYLYAALMETAPFLKDDSRIPVWEQRLAGVLGQVVLADKRYRRGQAVLRGRPGVAFR